MVPVSEILAKIRNLRHIVLLEDLIDYLHDLLILLTVSIFFFIGHASFLRALISTFISVALIQHFDVLFYN